MCDAALRLLCITSLFIYIQMCTHTPVVLFKNVVRSGVPVVGLGCPLCWRGAHRRVGVPIVQGESPSVLLEKIVRLGRGCLQTAPDSRANRLVILTNLDQPLEKSSFIILVKLPPPTSITTRPMMGYIIYRRWHVEEKATMVTVMLFVVRIP